jgi:hypothetical protein
MAGILIILGVSASLWALILLGGLPSRVAWFFFPMTVPAVAATVLVWTVTAMIKTRDAGRTPILTLLVALLALYPASWWPVNFPFAYPASERRIRPGLDVRLPLNGPVRVFWGGDLKLHNYHGVFPDQRWAFDLGIDPNPDELAVLGLPPTAFGCWGVPVLAPVTGTVHAAHDGEPDNAPGPRASERPDPAGNYVDLEVTSTNTHLLIAHFRQGSLRVVTGQSVAEGDTLGSCGNSGNSTVPHVHIHHQREPWARSSWWRLAEGLPLRFSDFRGDAEPHGGGSEDADGYWHWTGSILEHIGN